MLIDTRKLQTVANWAKDYEHGGRRGISSSAVHKIFRDDNDLPGAVAIRKVFRMISIDGVKFIVKNSDIK
jgi:hypothetical protein